MSNQNTTNLWNTSEKFIFRAILIFFASFLLNNGIIPYVSEYWGKFEQFIGHWFKGIAFGMSNVVNHDMNGSGDTSDDWAAQLFFVLFSLFAAAIWTIIDRKSRTYDNVYYWLRVAVRYCLGLTMLSYGVAKLFPDGQFSYPSLNAMTRPAGNFTPMGIAWLFFGYSYTYSFFGGLMEVIGGVLLFFRKTTLAATLLLITVIANIVMINFSYDVSVKLYSSIYFILALFLLHKDAQRLWNFLFGTESTIAASLEPTFENKWVNRGRYALKGLVVLLAIGFPLYQTLFEDMGGGRKESSLHGIYEVEKFSRNGREQALLMNDTTIWKRIVIGEGYSRNDFYGKINFSLSNAKRSVFEINDTTSLFVVKIAMDTMQNFNGKFQKIDSNYLIINGLMRKDTIEIKLKKEKMPPLHTHGIHWISEKPHNY